MAECPHGSSMPDDLIPHIVISQAGLARHKCVACAYASGVAYSGSQTEMEQCNHGSIAPKEILSGLPVYQGYPARHGCATCAFTEGVAIGVANPDRDTVEIADAGQDESQGSVEGTPVWRTHRTYERNSQNRAKAIMYHGNRCLGCEFSFDANYTAEHARGYIEVHHIHPLSEGSRVVNPYEDLIPLCANCHRMVHRARDGWLNLEELRELIAKAQEKTDNNGS